MPRSEVAIIVESHNEGEHSSVERLIGALDAAQDAARRYGDARVLCADNGSNTTIADVLRERFPGIERVAVGPDAGYDVAKEITARAADARVIVFLDGDCLPEDGLWLQRLTAPVLAGEAVATAGFTTYEGGWWSRVLTVMDFGFLLPATTRPVECYASNNAAFLASSLATTGIPAGDLRTHCYAHAQVLKRQGTPMQLVPGARVRHEPVPLVTERLCRGWSLVAGARVDPCLPEAKLLRWGLLATPAFWLDAVRCDAWRALRHGADAGLGPLARVAAIPVMLAVRMLDLLGIVAALRGRPDPTAPEPRRPQPATP